MEVVFLLILVKQSRFVGGKNRELGFLFWKIPSDSNFSNDRRGIRYTIIYEYIYLVFAI